MQPYGNKMTLFDEVNAVNMYVHDGEPVPIPAIARRFNVSRSYMCNVLDHHGVTRDPLRFAYRQSEPDPLAAEVIDLWEDGKSTKRIATLLVIPRHEVALLVVRWCTINLRVRKMVRHVLINEPNLVYKKVRKLSKANTLVRPCDCCGFKARLHIDHCHSTGIVRGLLCVSCNSGLGKFKDNVGVMRSAIKYLTK